MRLSPSRRLDRALDALLPPLGIERRVRNLPSPLKMAYAQWRQRCDHALALYADRPPSWLYEQMLAGESVTPPMPFALRKALNANEARVTVAMSVTDAADLYRAVLEGSK